MVAHGSTAGDRISPLIRVATVAVLLVAAVTAGALVADVAAGETGDLERDGADLIVDISGINAPDEVVVNVTEPTDELRYVENATGAGDEIRIGVQDPAEGTIEGTDLTAATVTVTVETNDGRETVAENATVDLSYAAFDESAPTWIDDGEVRVPMDGDAITGFGGSATVGVTSGSGDEAAFDPIDANVTDDGTQLSIDHAKLVDAVEPSETISLDVRSNGDRIAEAPISYEPELRAPNDELAVWHPLIEKNTEYTVEVNGDPVDGESLSMRDAEIGIDNHTAVGNEISVDGGGLSFDLNGTDLVVHELNATVTDDGLVFEQGVSGLGVSAAMDASDGRQLLDERQTIGEDRTLAIDGVSPDDELLLSTDAGTATVSLAKATTESVSQSGMPYLVIGALLGVPLVAGGGLGVAASMLGGRPKRRRLVLAAGLTILPLLVLTTVILVITGNDLNSVDLAVHGSAVVGLLLGTVVSSGAYRFLGSKPGGGATKTTVSVDITDGERKHSGRIPVVYRKPDSNSWKDKRVIRNGSGTVTIPGSGSWELMAVVKTDDGKYKSDIVPVSGRNAEATLTISLPTNLTVTDGESGKPITGATVRREDGTTVTTGADGMVTVESPEDDSSETIEIDHKKYQATTTTVSFGQQRDHTVELRPRTGSIRIVSQIDGTPTESMELRVTPESGERFLRDRSEGSRTTTGRNGVATRENVMVGQYRIEIPSPGGRSDVFKGGEERLTVREGGTATAEVDARFTWTLSREQRSRIDAIRTEVRSLSDHSRRDTTIPQYYGSVVESMLDGVESLPDAGHHFVGTSTDPETAADLTLDAAERAVEAINDAMTTKRNVDLFAACTDMPSSTVRWDGEFDIADLLERLDSEPTAQRNELKERYEEVADQIERSRGDVSEIGPVKEMHQRAWELVRATSGGQETIATAYASLLVLDAVASFFEHDALHERLSRTVF